MPLYVATARVIVDLWVWKSRDLYIVDP